MEEGEREGEREREERRGIGSMVNAAVTVAEE